MIQRRTSAQSDQYQREKQYVPQQMMNYGAQMPMMPYYMPMMMHVPQMGGYPPQMMPYNNQMMNGGFNNQFMRNYNSQQEFNTFDPRQEDHFISLKNNKGKREPFIQNTRNKRIQEEVDEDIEKSYKKPQRKHWTFEEFKQYTLPRLQLRKIIKIQALIRGAYVRKKLWPQKVYWHQGSVRFTDALIDHYIEDIFIPDLVLEILTKNRIYENIDLYSDENKILFSIRQDIMDRTVRSMTKQLVKATTDQIVNEYLNKRFRNKTIDEQDPLRMVASDMMNKVMKNIARDICKSQLPNVVFDYLIEAQFIGLFNNYYIRREIRHTCKDALEDLAISQVIDDYLDRIVYEAVPIICQGELTQNIKQQENEEISYAFNEYIDRCLLEIMIENLSKMYEEEEREIHFTEQADKKRRDEIRAKNQQAKLEDSQFNMSQRSDFQQQQQPTNLQMQNANVRDRYTAQLGQSQDLLKQNSIPLNSNGYQTPTGSIRNK